MDPIRESGRALSIVFSVTGASSRERPVPYTLQPRLKLRFRVNRAHRGNFQNEKSRPRGAALNLDDEPTRPFPPALASGMARRNFRHRSKAPSLPSDADTSPVLPDDECCDCSGIRDRTPTEN